MVIAVVAGVDRTGVAKRANAEGTYDEDAEMPGVDNADPRRADGVRAPETPTPGPTVADVDAVGVDTPRNETARFGATKPDAKLVRRGAVLVVAACLLESGAVDGGAGELYEAEGSPGDASNAGVRDDGISRADGCT